jgi:signal transduction histidine kinase
MVPCSERPHHVIGNAIDSMRNGGRLVVRTRKARLSKAGIPGIRIPIGDTGDGIPKDVLPRVFEPFYTTKGINGTGLGLWISFGIVQKHYGRLQVRSRTEESKSGTVLSLLLPSYPGKLDRNKM